MRSSIWGRNETFKALFQSATLIHAHRLHDFQLPLQSPTLHLSVNGKEVDLSWSKYAGDHFQYYKVVRSVSSDPTWPLAGDSQLLAAITNINQTTVVDSSVRAGKTYKYRVYVYTHETFAAANSGSVVVPACETDDGTVLAISNIVTVTIPGTAPTPPAIVSLDLTATVQADGSVALNWSKYTGSYFNYYAVPGNIDQLGIFRERATRLWRHTLLCRSQLHRITWPRMHRLAARWLPQPRVLHPYPDCRFAASHSR